MKIRILLCLAIFSWLTTAVVQAQDPMAGNGTGWYGTPPNSLSYPTSCGCTDCASSGNVTSGCASSGCASSGCASSGCASSGCASSGCCSSGRARSGYSPSGWARSRYAPSGCAGCVSYGGCASANSTPCSRYISVFGGWTDWNRLDANLDLAGIMNGSASVDVQTEHGGAFGVAVGRYLNFMDFNLRSELEFAYRHNSLETTNASASGLGSTTIDLDGQIDTFSGMYNVYYDLRLNCQTRFRPYVGGGVGFAFVDYDMSSPILPGAALAVDTSTFVYQGIGGVAYQWSNRVELFAEYRLFGTDDFVEATLTAPAIPLNASLDADGYTHNVFAGVRVAIR